MRKPIPTPIPTGEEIPEKKRGREKREKPPIEK